MRPMIRWLGAWLLGLGWALGAGASQDFLEPEQAFRHSARVLDERTLELRFEIADGYYMYREQFAFTTIRLCLGLAAPQSGRITAFGLDVPERLREVKQRLGVVSQFDSLDPDFSCAENLSVFARYFGVPRAVVAQRVPREGQEAAARARCLQAGRAGRLARLGAGGWQQAGRRVQEDAGPRRIRCRDQRIADR